MKPKPYIDGTLVAPMVARWRWGAMNQWVSIYSTPGQQLLKNLKMYHFIDNCIWRSSSNLIYLEIVIATDWKGGGPRVVVSTAALHARVRGSVPGLGLLKETKNVSSQSTCESQYCGEPPWPRGSVLGLRPPGLEFQILCLEDSVISIISPSSGGSTGPV